MKILFFCFVALSHSPCLHSEDSKTKEIKIDNEDKELLNIFFGALVSYETFPYVLCGQKPMGILSLRLDILVNPRRLNNFLFENFRKKYMLMKGWYAWEKYQNQINYSNFVLAKSNDNDILFINKKLFLDVVEKNINVFKNKLNYEITPDKLLKLVCDPELQSEIIYKSDHLLGILLGFGYENSKEYEYQNYLITQLQNPLFGVEFKKLDKHQQDFMTLAKINDKKFRGNIFPIKFTLSEEWNKREKRSDCFPNEPYEYQENINIAWPLGFCITNTNKSRSENEELLKRYHKDREIIADAYRDRNFLDTTLRFFLSENSAASTE